MLGFSQITAKKINWIESLLTGLTVLFSVVPFVAIILILEQVITKGWPAISWEFLSAAPSGGMMKGGIFPCIFGTVFVTLMMIIMALPMGIGAGIYLVEYAGQGPIVRVIRAAVNNLAGVPSIVFGLFGVGFFVLFVGRGIDTALNTGFVFGQPCMLWASATLAVLVLPIMIVSTEEALNAVPDSHRNASLALGATKWETIWNVVLPQARGGILTGAILSISRGVGETAPILFTGVAYFLPRLPVVDLFGVIPMVNPASQFMGLSYHIFVMATQSIDPVKTLPIQYGTTLVLISLTFLMNFTAIGFRIHFRRQQEKFSH
ncbi:MAG: phosphate ABC transporter permease PstA [Candidatus Omnitrophica bacterium]|nr:phosphate ABC transporter permease PstA [Candidatus Omnitrophota bacterium]